MAAYLRTEVVEKIMALGGDYVQMDAPNYAQWHVDPDNRAAFASWGHATQGALENADAVEMRVLEASKTVGRERLAISPQCGFASGEAGNPLTHDEQAAKLRRVAEVARKLWRA